MVRHESEIVKVKYIGKEPNQVDIKDVSTQRLLAYKKKHYSHSKCFNDHNREGDVVCSECKTDDPTAYKWCKNYEKNRNDLTAELATREHIEK